jgi:outer membrane murein-binding lipoprotein Lpp
MSTVMGAGRDNENMADRLRGHAAVGFADSNVILDAADRIEALNEQVDQLEADSRVHLDHIDKLEAVVEVMRKEACTLHERCAKAEGRLEYLAETEVLHKLRSAHWWMTEAKMEGPVPGLAQVLVGILEKNQ